MATVISIAPYRFLPAKIGGQKNIALFYKYLSRYLQLTCLTVRSNSNELAEGYEALAFFSDAKFRYINPFYFFRLRKLIRQRAATHLMMEHPYFGWLAILLQKFTGIKLIIHSHNIEGLRFKDLGKWWWRILWMYERFVHRQADYNLFITGEDMAYALTHFGLQKEKCLVATYGIERNAPPSKEEREQAKAWIRTQYQLQPEEKILLFVGAFAYQPNYDAFLAIENEIAPLLNKMNFPHKIFICGPGLDAYQNKNPNIIITGFVEDISLYFKAADVFINPVVEGGGIKTKLVEALGYGCNAVSTRNGAIGVDAQLTGGKLLVADNTNWRLFSDMIALASTNIEKVNPDFFKKFSWMNSTQQVAGFVSKR